MSLQQELISVRDKNKWEQALSFVPHTFTHMHWYNYAMHVASKRDVFLYVGKGENFQAICPVSPRRKNLNDEYDITTPYGFSGFSSVGNYPTFKEEWHSFMGSNGYICGHIALHPFFASEQLYKDEECYPGKRAYYLDLSLSLDEIYKKFSDDHRHRLRQWEKNNISIVLDKNEKIINSFIDYYSLSLEKRNAAAIYDFGREAWKILLRNPNTCLFSTLINREVEATAAFIVHEDIADYFMLTSTHAGRAHARGIIWEAIQFFHGKKVKWLHLGCGVREDDALEQFKARFGATPFVTRSLKQIYKLDSYRHTCKRYNSDPDDIENYFPSYWAARTI